MEEERRKQTRMRTYKTAKIAFNGQRSVLDCLVRNLSSHGALLQIATPVGVPEDFDLVFDGDGTVKAAHVIWRSENKIGVNF